jgi:predicted HicB family RNase H-like nuclease
MANVIQYRGYHAKIEYSADDNMLIGSVINIRDSLHFHGNSIPEITQYFHDSIDNYLEMCEAIGKTPDKEYKGSFNIRIPQELHRKAALMAEEEGISLNQLIQNAIENVVNPDKYKSIVTVLPVFQDRATMYAEPGVYSLSMFRKQPSGQLSS